MSSATGKTAKRRIVIIGVLMLCITATTMLLTGCGESQQDKQLRECKEERLAELHSTGIVDSSYYEYNNKRPVEYYEFYRSQVINEAVNNIDKATTKDEVYAISSEAIIEIKSVYTNYLTMSAYRMCETSLPLADALYESEDLHIGAALTSHASPLSSDPYLSCWKVMLQPGVTAKIYYSNFFSPQNNMPSPINVATAENDGKEQSFSFL